ncbi:MAG: TonB-dependent receptor plug domain-containing protein [Elusimicrobiota bacterium]
MKSKENIKNLKSKIKFFGSIIVQVLSVILILKVISLAEPAIDLGTVEVIGNKYPRMEENLFSTRDIIDRKDIKESGKEEISSYLEDNVNINVYSGGTGFISGLAIRGISGGTKNNKTKVWLDGCPVNTLLRGFVLESISLGSVERISVNRGPGSVLYGGGALNGSLNIISSIPAGESYKAGYEWGSFDTDSANFKLQNRNQNFAWSADFDFTDTAGFIEEADSRINPATILKGGIAGEYNAGNNILNLNARYYQSVKDKPNYSYGSGAFMGVEEDIKTRVNIYSLSWRHEFSNMETVVRTFVNTDSQKSDQADKESSLNAGGILEFNGRITDKLKAVSGCDWENLYLKQEVDGSDYYQRRVSPFLQMAYQFYKNMEVAAGGRYSINSEFSGEFSPKVGFNWGISKYFNIYGNFSRGFRPPTVKELYSDSLNYYGNTDLQPEKSINYETGLKYNSEKISFRVGGYKMKVVDVIVNQPPEDTEYDNEGNKIEQKVQNIDGNWPYMGIEFSGKVVPVKNYYAELAYNYLDPGDLTFHTDRHRIKAKAGFKNSVHNIYATSVSAFDRYLWDYEEREREDYNVFNLFYSVNLNETLSIYGEVENITDEDYYVYFYHPTPGRKISAGLKFVF